MNGLTFRYVAGGRKRKIGGSGGGSAPLVAVERERAIPVGDSWRKLKRLEIENERLKEALAWYALQQPDDGGKRAKVALGARV